MTESFMSSTACAGPDDMWPRTLYIICRLQCPSVKYFCMVGHRPFFSNQKSSNTVSWFRLEKSTWHSIKFSISVKNSSKICPLICKQLWPLKHSFSNPWRFASPHLWVRLVPVEWLLQIFSDWYHLWQRFSTTDGIQHPVNNVIQCILPFSNSISQDCRTTNGHQLCIVIRKPFVMLQCRKCQIQ